MCLEFSKALQEVASEVFAAEVVIVRVEQTYIHGNKRHKEAHTEEARTDCTNQLTADTDGLAMECDDELSADEDTGSMKLPVIISPDCDKLAKRSASDSEGEDSGGKKSRGEKKHRCDLCGAVFIYLTSYIKHIKRHGQIIIPKPKLPPGHVPPECTPPSKSPQKAYIQTSAKLPKLLPKPEPVHQAQHQMVTRQSASACLTSLAETVKNGAKVSPTVVPLLVPHVTLPKPISPPSLPTTHVTPHFTPIAPKLTPALPPALPPAPKVPIAPLNVPVVPKPEEIPPCVASKLPPHLKVDSDNVIYMRVEDPLDCWVCLRQFKYPTSFLKHMLMEHELTVKLEEQGERRRRGNRRLPEPPTEKTTDDFRGHQVGQVVALHMKTGGEYVLMDSELNEIVLGEYLLCSICLTSFNYKIDYIKHMSRAHGVIVKDMTEDLPLPKVDSNVFQCHVCSKKFFYRIPYEQHLKQIHDIEVVIPDMEECNRSYVCPVCSTVFIYKTSFEKHMAREHGMDVSLDGEDLLRCGHCLACFQHPDDLESHMNTEHGDTVAGEHTYEAGVTVAQPERVTDPDSKLSLIQCDFCSKSFKFQIAYSKHLRVAHSTKIDGEDSEAAMDLSTDKTFAPGVSTVVNGSSDVKCQNHSQSNSPVLGQ